MPGFHSFLGFAQTPVGWVGDGIKYLIICFAVLLLPSIFTSIRVFLRLFRLSYNNYHKRSIQMAVSIISHVILFSTCSHPNFIPMGTAFLKITNNFYFTNLFVLPNLSVLWGRVDYFFIFEILHLISFGILNMIRLGFSLNSLGTSLKSLSGIFSFSKTLRAGVP